MEISEAKKQVIRAGIQLSRTGLIARTWGNVSCRLDEETFLITASGRDYLTLTEEEVVRVKRKDLSYEGPFAPSSEQKIHREIYRLKQDARFVIHTHQENASVVSAMGIEEAVFDREYKGIGSRVICARYGLPGSDRLCANTAAALKASEGKAVILKNHGAVCYGGSYEEAFATCRSLEEACGRYLEMRCSGISWNMASREIIQNQHEKAVIWNCSPVVKAFLREEISLRPYLDDFAQMAGNGMKLSGPEDIEGAAKRVRPILVKGRGAFCVADNVSDAEALSMLVEKNCKAYFAAKVSGGKPLSTKDCLLMRKNYLQKYSRLKEGNF